MSNDADSGEQQPDGESPTETQSDETPPETQSDETPPEMQSDETPAGLAADEQPPESQGDAGASTAASADSTDDGGKRNVLRYLEWAGLALCIVLVLVAGLRVYSGVGAFISLWIESRYEPIVSAGFNLAVLLVAAYGAAILSRRLTATQ